MNVKILHTPTIFFDIYKHTVPICESSVKYTHLKKSFIDETTGVKNKNQRKWTFASFSNVKIFNCSLTLKYSYIRDIFTYVINIFTAMDKTDHYGMEAITYFRMLFPDNNISINIYDFPYLF